MAIHILCMDGVDLLGFWDTAGIRRGYYYAHYEMLLAFPWPRQRKTISNVAFIDNQINMKLQFSRV